MNMNKKRKHWWTLLLLCIAGVPAGAQEITSATGLQSRQAVPAIAVESGRPVIWKMADFEQFASEHSPAIKVITHRIAALEGRWTQEGLGPNPNFAYIYDDFGAHTDGTHGVEVSQEIITKQKLSRAQNVVCQEIQVEKENLEGERFRVITDVRMAVYHYIAVKQKVTLYKELVSLKKQALQAAEVLARSGEGEVTRTSVLALGVDTQQAEVDYANAQNDLIAAWKQLACLLGDPDLAPVTVDVSLEMTDVDNSWEVLCATLLSTSPEIAAAKAEIERAYRQYDLEEAKNSSNFTLDGELKYAADAHVFHGKVGVSFPLRVRDRNQGNIAMARSEIHVAKMEYERTVLRVQSRFADVYRNHLNARKSATRYRDQIVPYAAEAMKLIESGYLAGQMNYLDVLNAHQQFTSANIEYINSQTEFWQSLALLEGKLLSGCLGD